ncbi:hypothetical protein [Rhizohabitans arisaemae]|uniref:hypothetical protein n=1 Tax=Rhizohabitans arisaemae TaxID=2720610 RepID=UPI0024B12D02|nr:hypothetical protein [Rhizohabitans arisaemae]
MNGEEPEGPPPTYTPWLVVRATPSDMGRRPVPAGTPFWASPDITVTPSDPWGRVTAGDEVLVSVTVQNLGYAPASGVRARFWWADPSAGISPTLATVIGASDRTSIAAGQAETLPCTTLWTPQFVNGGHECLIVEVSCLGDPLTSTFRPDLDRHVGQRNVTVLAGEGEPHPMTLKLANPFSEEAPTTLYVRSFRLSSPHRLIGFGLHVHPIDALIHLQDRTLTDPFAALGIRTGPAEPMTGLQVGGLDIADVLGGGFGEEAQRLLRERRDHDTDFGTPAAETTLPAAGVAMVPVTVGLGGTGGQALIHRLTQVTDGVDVGGYTVVSLPG